MQENEQLLAKNEITGLSGRLKDEATPLIIQSPNSRIGIGGIPILPFTHLVHLHELGERGAFFTKGYNQNHVIAKKDSLVYKFERKINATDKERKKERLRSRLLKKLNKKERKIKEGNQLMRWGEKLAVYDQQKTANSIKNIKTYLNSKGYFKSEIAIDSTLLNPRKNILAINYEVDLGSHFFVDSISYNIGDTVLHKLIKENQRDAPLKKGYYDQGTLIKERDFIYNLAVNNGYFEFSKQYITFEIDSTLLGRDTLSVREIVRNPPDRSHHKIYYIDSIVFISEASLTHSFRRTKEFYKDITFNFGKNRYSKKILQWRIPLAQDDRYSRDLTIETQRQLSYLDNFKFVNINYDTTGNKFVANIFTSPLDKFQTSSEIGFVQNSTSSQNLSPFINISLKNRNAFRALETININLNAKIEGISSVSGEADNAYSSRQIGADLSFNFPQFLFPLGRYYKKKMGLFNPKTRLTFGAGTEIRENEYNRTTFTTSLAYSWQVRDQIKHTLTPIQLSLIDSENDPDFEDYLMELDEQGNTYTNSFRSAYVNTTSYQLDLTLGQYNAGKDGGFVRFFIENGGHFNNLFGETSFQSDSIERYQFFKGNIDLRKIEKVKRKLNIAYRLNIGVAIAYGDNQSLPYEKYFFAGGSNSLRAWNPRRLGPGAYGEIVAGTDSENSRWNQIDYSQEQPGELIIESSFEFRQKLVGFLEGALFFDAGNIWLLRGSTVNSENDPEGDDGKFRFSDFGDEIAMNTGLGLRFDLSFLILRLDMGVKLFDPAQKKGNRFVGDNIFRNFGQNSAFNIGIGYPF